MSTSAMDRALATLSAMRGAAQVPEMHKKNLPTNGGSNYPENDTILSPLQQNWKTAKQDAAHLSGLG